MTFPFRSRTRCASVQMINKLLKPQLCPSASSPALLPLLGPQEGPFPGLGRNVCD